MINFHQAKYYIRHYFSANRKGHSVHSPFAYQLCEEVFYNTNRFYDFEKFNQIRKELLLNRDEIIVEDFGAGSKTFSDNKRIIGDIAKKGISTSKQSELLYKLINFLNPSNIIELGTSVGLNTLYLAGASHKTQVYTLEGSKSLFEFAKQLSGKTKTNNCKYINGKFDEGLPVLLNELTSLDFFYVDGNHTYNATLNYFELALNKKNEQSVFIFDDIYWSEGMTKAWEEIKKHPEVTLSIDSFYFGMVFFRKEIKEKVNLKFFI